MRTRYFIIFVVLLSFCFSSAQSQSNCTVPLSPVLTSVSVQPETDRTEFTWIPSESTDIAAYILYIYEGQDGHAVDTVWDPGATSHVISNMAPKYSSVSYVVAAYRLSAIPGKPGCVSPLSNVLSTIFCEADADTCNKKINISWNSYPSYPKVVTGYSVMLSVDGSPFTEEALTDPEITTFTINNFITDAEYCLYIRANLEGALVSTSNKVCVLTRMQRPPGWINADYATVGTDSRIRVSFTVDPVSEITHFLLERKTGTGNYESVAALESVDGSVQYTDADADINVASYYRLSAINSCDIPITVSNIASNMVLSLKRNKNEFILSWNSYRQWLGQISGYRLFIDTGQGFEEKAVIDANDSLYTLDYKDIMYEVSSDNICMYVSAAEISNPYGITGQSSSPVICTEPIEAITVPNIFTPNGDLVNDLFKPVLSFTPGNYHLIVSDQHGLVLFETRDYNDSWDGSKSGNPISEAVCLWFLKVSTPSGKSLTRTGTVTVLTNP